MGMDLSKFVRKTKTVEIAGKDLVFTELTLADMAQFSVKVKADREANIDKRRERLLEQAKKIDGEIEPLKLLAELEKPPSDEEIESEMDTVEGVGFLTYLSLKHHYPEIKLEEALSLISINDMMKLTDVLFGSKTQPETPAKNRRRPVTKK